MNQVSHKTNEELLIYSWIKVHLILINLPKTKYLQLIDLNVDMDCGNEKSAPLMYGNKLTSQGFDRVTCTGNKNVVEKASLKLFQWLNRQNLNSVV